MLKIVVKFILLFGVLGCGTMFKGNRSDDEVSIPKKISTEIPNILKKRKEENISQGYQQLKDNIQELTFNQIMININLLFSEQLIDEIDSRCQKEKLNHTCFIDEGEVSFVFDKKFINDLNSVVGESTEELFRDISDIPISLGVIEFTKYDKKREYQYNLKIDTSSISKKLGKNEIAIQTLKWSKDESHILTIFEDETQKDKTILTILYLKKEGVEEEMRVKSNYSSKVSIEKGYFSLDIIEKNDSNRSFEINSSYHDVIPFNGEVYEDFSLSRGEISTQGGFLDIEGSYINHRLFKERYLFDGKGEIILNQYCEDELVCDMNDSSTWIDISSITTSQNILLGGTVGGLKKNRRYFIFAPDTDIENNRILTAPYQESLVPYIVGELYIFDNKLYGELYSSKYVDRLDRLIIARVSTDGSNKYIELVEQKDRPILKIYGK